MFIIVCILGANSKNARFVHPRARTDLVSILPNDSERATGSREVARYETIICSTYRKSPNNCPAPNNCPPPK